MGVDWKLGFQLQFSRITNVQNQNLEEMLWQKEGLESKGKKGKKRKNDAWKFSGSFHMVVKERCNFLHEAIAKAEGSTGSNLIMRKWNDNLSEHSQGSFSKKLRMVLGVFSG